MINKLTFPRELRLLTPSDFNHVFTQSFRIGSPVINLVIRENELNHFRLGFAIAKKQIKHAHERNRIKRVIRDYFRINQYQLPNFDMIVMVRTGIIELTNAEIRAILEKLCLRLSGKQKKTS
ncbi:ribonuclease P protein component [Orbaceae bacterium ac157xtp]